MSSYSLNPCTVCEAGSKSHMSSLDICQFVIRTECKRKPAKFKQRHGSLFNSVSIICKLPVILSHFTSHDLVTKTALGHYVDLNIKHVLEKINNISKPEVHLTELKSGWSNVLKTQCARKINQPFLILSKRNTYSRFPLGGRGSPFSKQSSNLMKWNEWERGGMVNRLWKHFIS